MIQLRKLQYELPRQRRFVEGLDLAIAPGEVYGLIGPFSSGKSTVLKMLATLFMPTGGEALVQGHSILRQAEAVRPLIGYLSEFRGAYDDMAIQDYLEFYALACKVPRERISRRIDELLELVGLDGRREDFVESLGREGKQRLGLARALVHDPPVLLLDEPGAGLDIPARLAIRELLTRLRGPRRTILIGSNVMTEAAGLCQRIGLMRDGRMLTEGTIDALAPGLPYVRTLEIRLGGSPAEAAAASGPAEAWAEAARPRVTRWQRFDRALLLSIDLALDDPARLVAELRGLGVAVEGFRELEVNLDPNDLGEPAAGIAGDGAAAPDAGPALP